jgi:2,3-bisphosphoglycerate-independent phosphoglycerate mutase
MKPACLIVLDGWGLAPPGPGNAITLARPRHIDTLWNDNPHTMLDASGTAVGLMPGYIGNSEVGHLHIGAGRLVKQDMTRIFESIKDGSFFKNKVLISAMKHKRVHLLGLISDAGVHSHIQHLFALLKLAAKCKVREVYVHAITDGRDVPPKSALKYIKMVENELAKYGKDWKIATVLGRYYAMDRDNRWNREHKAYDAMVNGEGHHHKTPETAVLEAYKRGESDEFVAPTVVEEKGLVKPGDSIIFWNFRSDRAREITKAFVQGKFNKFKRKKLINLHFVCLTQYDPDIKSPVAFPPIFITNSLGEIISKNKLKQFRLAETEKWAHVTFFFNGLSGNIFKGEDRLLIPSPKVTTYDKKPAMSAVQITKSAIEALNSKKYQFILINFANADMVGHTGKIKETIEAVKTVDECLAYVVSTAQNKGYDVVITADHGNAEQKLYPNGGICTAHTTNKVPFIIVSSEKHRLRKIKRPAIYHVAPTVLQLMGIARPKEMEPGLLR